jgi:hypothetical protein
VPRVRNGAPVIAASGGDNRVDHYGLALKVRRAGWAKAWIGELPVQVSRVLAWFVGAEDGALSSGR